MSNEIDVLYTQFKDDYHFLAERKKSRLQELVTIQSVDNAAEFVFNTLGSVEVNETTTRFAKITFSDIEQNRRGVAIRDFDVTVPFSSLDAAKTKLDISSGYAREVAFAMNRKKDELIYDAAFADVLTGQKLGTVVTAANDGVETIAANSTGLTFAKAQSIKESFMAKELGIDEDESIVLVMSEKQHTDALNEDKFTNNDFVDGKVLNEGRITHLLGMRVVIFGSNPDTGNGVVKKVGANRECLAFISRNGMMGGIQLAINNEVGISIEKRTDLKSTWQVQSLMSLSAVRTEGNLIKKFLCQE